MKRALSKEKDVGVIASRKRQRIKKIRDRQTDKQTDTQTDRQTQTNKDRLVEKMMNIPYCVLLL